MQNSAKTFVKIKKKGILKQYLINISTRVYSQNISTNFDVFAYIIVERVRTRAQCSTFIIYSYSLFTFIFKMVRSPQKTYNRIHDT